MTSRGALAYAHARMRGRKSRLLTRADAAPLFTAGDAASMHRALAALEVEDPLRRLLSVYATAIRADPRGAPLFRALLRLHELENVKLLWRVTARHGPPEALARLWLDLGPLATVAKTNPANVHELAEALAHTPYGATAKTAARVHGDDVAAAELAFDRWASQQLLDEARRLPRREAQARRLIEDVVRERDAQLVQRGEKWYGLTTVSGIVSPAPRRVPPFAASPFLLAPTLAVLLLAEGELRAVRALAERQGDQTLDAPLLRALAGSRLGA